jgi:hypothetical protein
LLFISFCYRAEKGGACTGEEKQVMGTIFLLAHDDRREDGNRSTEAANIIYGYQMNIYKIVLKFSSIRKRFKIFKDLSSFLFIII